MPPAPLVAFAAAPTISATSLGGNVSNLLFNNVLTTRITPTLKSTFRYRYYDHQTDRDPITTSYWYIADSASAVEGSTSFGVNYTKQNASGELVWNPIRWLTVGTTYSWEQWQRERRDTHITDEHSGKLFADATPFTWSRLRASLQYGERRYDSYVTELPSNNSPGRDTYRLFDMASRDRTKGIFSLDLYTPHNVTVTPTAGFRNDQYLTNPFAAVALRPEGPRGELGLLSDESWNTGIELGWRPSRRLGFFASYIYEEAERHMMINTNTAMFDVTAADIIETFLFGANVDVTENIDLKGNLSYMRATGTFTGMPGGIAPIAPAGIAAPGLTPISSEVTRFDLQARYKFDPEGLQRQLGWKGEAYAKLRYLWERSAVSDWAAVNQNYAVLISPNAGQKSIFLGWNNPNYEVHLIAASFGIKW